MAKINVIVTKPSKNGQADKKVKVDILDILFPNGSYDFDTKDAGRVHGNVSTLEIEVEGDAKAEKAK